MVISLQKKSIEPAYTNRVQTVAYTGTYPEGVGGSDSVGV